MIGILLSACSGSSLESSTTATPAAPPTSTSYTLTVSKTGSGSVSSSPAGINCGATCSATFVDNAVVTLTATPAAGYSFTGWSGACSGTGSCTVSMTDAQSVTATFSQNISGNYALTVSMTGSGTVTSTPGGINCGSTCSASYTSGTSVTLSAAAASGYSFSGWGGACSGTGTCTVSMTVARSVSATFIATPSFDGRPDFTGIWGIGGGENYSTAERPWYKGTVVQIDWKDIEPANNAFDFTPLDAKIKTAVDNGLYVMFMVYHSYCSPKWLYDAGVPAVLTVGGATYPYYLDPTFKTYLFRMINKVADHAKSLPAQQRNRIIGLQAPQGTIGDPMPYRTDPVDPQFVISSADWQAFETEIFTVYAEAYKDTNPAIVPLFKIGNDLAVDDWLQQTYPKSWRKTNMVAQMYQFNGETDPTQLDLHTLTFGTLGDVRVRGEFDAAPTTPTGWFTEAPVWNVYWQCLWMLTYGVDMFNQYPVLLENYQPHVEAFTFFTKYAGYKDASKSKGAFVALHDGLDIKDTKRFPESTFGTYSGADSPDRYAAIASAYKDFGAKQEDTANQANTGISLFTNITALNDVGYKIWTDNYGLFMRQINANGTSQGYWRVGSLDQPYGRFARGFNHASGKDYLYFDIDDQFFSGQPLAGQYPVTVRVVYFDKGTGKWSLGYDGVGQPNKIAITVQNQDSGVWKEIKVTIPDGYFGNRGPNASDLYLQNTDTEDDIFHMVELTR